MFSSIFFLSRMQRCCCHCTPFPLCETTQWINRSNEFANTWKTHNINTCLFSRFVSLKFFFPVFFLLIRFAILHSMEMESCVFTGNVLRCGKTKHPINSTTQSTNKSISNSFSFTFDNVVSNRHTRISNRLTWNMKISASHMHTQARTAVMGFAPNIKPKSNRELRIKFDATEK